MISNELLKKKILDKAIHGRLVENDSSLKPIDVQQVYDDIPFEVPNNWKWAKLSDVSEFNVGKTPPTKNSIYWGDEIDWVSIADMNHRKLVQSTHRKLSNRALNSIFNNKLVPAGTLLMSFKLTIGRLAITSKECVHNEAIISIYPKQYLLRDYLMNALDALDLEKNVKSAIKGKTLNSKSLANIFIPIPPLEEQKKIVKRIEELFELIDKKEKNDEEKEKLKVLLKEKILDSAIHGKLVENDLTLPTIDVEEIKEDIPFNVPSNWKWSKLSSIFEIKGGKRIPKGYTFSDVGNHVYIRVADMENMTIKTTNLKYIDEKVFNIIKNYIITDKDLYITVAGTIGQVGSVPKELNGMNLTENADRLIPKKINKEFYKYILNCRFMQKKIKESTTKSAQPKLAIKRIKELIIPIPPLEQQKKIVEKIEECFKLIEQL